MNTFFCRTPPVAPSEYLVITKIHDLWEKLFIMVMTKISLEYLRKTSKEDCLWYLSSWAGLQRFCILHFNRSKLLRKEFIYTFV